MIGKYNNQHKGQTALLLGNGPSLKTIPRGLLYKYVSMGSNGIFLAYTDKEETVPALRGFVPEYYVCINPLVLDQNKEIILTYPALALFLRADADIQGDKIYPIKSIYTPGFYMDPDQGLYEGFTVTYVMLQLAFYMGFTTVLLAGVDWSYQYTGQPNQLNSQVNPEANHYHPKYFVGQEWHNPDLIRSREAYQMAQRAYQADGRKIINLSPGTKLDVFPLGTYDEYL